MNRHKGPRVLRPRNQDELMRYLVYQASAVIQGAKPAELVTLKNGGCGCIALWDAMKVEAPALLRISVYELRRTKDAVSLLFYHPQAFAKTVLSLGEHPLLIQHGYAFPLKEEEALARLAERFMQESVPHEVGLFLGYPAKDVEAFAMGRQDHCFCSYWKVYEDREMALAIIDRIDSARERASRLLGQMGAGGAAAALCAGA